MDSSLIGVQVCRTDTLWNNGDADILVTGATFVGTAFSQTGLTFPFNLKAKSFTIFSLCGTPDQEGIILGSVSFVGTSGGRTVTLNLPLGIYGLKACASPLPLALFQGVKVSKGTSDTMCTTVTNCGTVSAVYTASISGADAADYTIISPNPSPVIAPQGTYDFCVQFNNPAAAPTTASLDISSANVATMKIPLTAESVCASLTGTAQVPQTGAGETKPFTFTLTNGGSGDWSPGTPVISGPDAINYAYVGTAPDPIPAGAQGTVSMTFHPTKPATTYVANIKFPNGGPCQDAVVSVDLSGEGIVSSVSGTTAEEGFNLEQSYPNPTAGNTWFTYTTPRETEVRITLTDLTGKRIRTLVSGRVSEGQHTVNFDAHELGSGTYIYLLESGNTRLVRQMILAK
jgi:hypothetical protein